MVKFADARRALALEHYLKSDLATRLRSATCGQRWAAVTATAVCGSLGMAQCCRTTPDPLRRLEIGLAMLLTSDLSATGTRPRPA
jgi:hypothetical protein